MSILGKLLIVLNLLAAAAFAYFTRENWNLRKELTYQEFAREVKLRGFPVEPRDPAPKGVDKDNAQFVFDVNSNVRVETIEAKRLNALLPQGGQVLGGSEAVADQTAEVKRLQKKVVDALPPLPPEGQDPKDRFAWLHAYLLNLARSGADRDGVNALFDLRFPERAYMARRDLPLLGRTASQQAALRALVEVADLDYVPANTPENVRATRVGLARESVKRFLLGEVPHAVAGGGDTAEAQRRLVNAIETAFAGKGGKEDVANAATDAAFKQVAELAGEPLTDRASIDRAAAAIDAYAGAKAVTPSEKTAMTGVVTLIRPPALGFNLVASIDKTAVELLNSKFDEAALPAKQSSAGEKARTIAHLLYHIDAHRHADKTPAVVADRKEWHQRVSTIVGLQEYVRAAEAQASEYAEAAQRLIAVITEEESSFRAQYQDQLQRVTTLYTQWLTLEAQYRAQEAITKENDRLKGERKTERDNLKVALEKATEDAKAALAKLEQTQAQLFAIQRQLRDAEAAVLNLEAELRKLELGPGSGRARREP